MELGFEIWINIEMPTTQKIQGKPNNNTTMLGQQRK